MIKQSGVSKANNEENKDIKLPIIMYHSILKDESKSGKYVVTPKTLEDDLQYITNKGYTTITMTDLIAYVYDNKLLPEKPIIITFDDGYYNNFGYAIPLLQKYNMKAVISIVGEYTDNYTETGEANLNYSYMRWEDVKQAMQTGNIEFQNHSYSLHSNANGRNGSMKKNGEATQEYENMIKTDLSKLQEEFMEHTNYTPNTYTYPFGAVSKNTTEILKSLGFKASLSCTSGVNTITKNPDCLYLLKRNNRPSNVSAESFFENLLE